MSRSGIGSLPVVKLSPAEDEYARQLHKAKVHKMELRWCKDDYDGCYFRRTRGLSALPDYSQVFDSAWLANRAVVEGDLEWSGTEPDPHPGPDDEIA